MLPQLQCLQPQACYSHAWHAINVQGMQGQVWTAEWGRTITRIGAEQRALPLPAPGAARLWYLACATTGSVLPSEQDCLFEIQPAMQ